MSLTILFWIGCEFCFFMIGFYMKYLPGDIFSTMTLQTVCTCIAFTSAGLISSRLGIKETIALSFLMATVGSYFMIGKPAVPLLILTKFGVDCA